MSSREPWTIAMFRPFSMLYLRGGQRFCRFGPREWGANIPESEVWRNWKLEWMKYEDGKRVFELWNQCGMFPNPKTKKLLRYDWQSNLLEVICETLPCARHATMPSKGPWCFCTKCLEFGWRLSHDSGFCCMFEPKRCWLEIFCRGCPLPRLHYIEFLMKQKKVTRARRALDRVCSLALPIGVFCVQLR